MSISSSLYPLNVNGYVGTVINSVKNTRCEQGFHYPITKATPLSHKITEFLLQTQLVWGGFQQYSLYWGGDGGYISSDDCKDMSKHIINAHCNENDPEDVKKYTAFVKKVVNGIIKQSEYAATYYNSSRKISSQQLEKFQRIGNELLMQLDQGHMSAEDLPQESIPSTSSDQVPTIEVHQPQAKIPSSSTDKNTWCSIS